MTAIAWNVFSYLKRNNLKPNSVTIRLEQTLTLSRKALYSSEIPVVSGAPCGKGWTLSH